MEGSDDGIRAFLLANGVEGVDNLTRQELEAFASALAADDNTAAAAVVMTGVAGSDSDDAVARMLENETHEVEIASASLALAQLEDELSSTEDGTQMTTTSNTAATASNTAAAGTTTAASTTTTTAAGDATNTTTAVEGHSRAQETSAESSSHSGVESSAGNGYEETAAAFIDITGCDPESAAHFLEAFGWDLESAVSVYVENPTLASASTSTSNHATAAETGGGSFSSPGIHYANFNHANLFETPPVSSMAEMFATGLVDSGGIGVTTDAGGSMHVPGLPAAAGVSDGDDTATAIPSVPNIPAIPALSADADGAEDVMRTLQQMMAQSNLDSMGVDTAAAATTSTTTSAGAGASARAGVTSSRNTATAGAFAPYAGMMGAGGDIGSAGLMARRIYGFGGGMGYDDDDDEYLYPDGNGDGDGQRGRRRGSGTGDEYDEHGVRRPDPIRKSRLLGPGSGAGGMGMSMGRMGLAGGGIGIGGPIGDELGALDNPSVEWLFPPASRLSYLGSLEQARAFANSEGRWVVVNLQSHDEFTSHLLNRDTWTDETVESILESTFLLWQRGHTSPDGAAYLRTYKLSETDDLPHIAVIDPRTGAKLMQLTGFIAPEDLSLKLVEFADKNSLAPSSSKASSRQSTSTDDITKLAPQQQSSKPSAASDAEANSSNISTTTTEPSTVAPVAGESKKIGVADVSHEAEEEGDGKVETPNNTSAGIERQLPDFGPVPAEPEDTNGMKVSIKLSSGKACVRSYPPATAVRALFAVVLQEDVAVREALLHTGSADSHSAAATAAAGPSSSSSSSSSSSGQSTPVAFDLVTRFPVQSLLAKIDCTLEECGLAGSQVLFRWAS